MESKNLYQMKKNKLKEKAAGKLSLILNHLHPQTLNLKQIINSRTRVLLPLYKLK